MEYMQNGKQHITPGSSKGKSNLTEPQPFEKFNWLIHDYYVRGENEQCKNLIKEEIARSNGQHDYLFYKQGVILKEEGKIQDALESFQICNKLDPRNIENMKEIAKCLFTLKRYKLALETYLEAEKIAEKPDFEIYKSIGECYLVQKDMGKAKEYAIKAVELGKQESACNLLIKILSMEKDYNAALLVSNSALETNPDSISMLVESGLLFARLGQTQQAFERLSTALAIEPDCKKALLAVGCIIQTHDDFDVALTKYKKALANDADSVALWNNVGMCFYGKQKFVAATSCLKRAQWQSPLNWKVLHNLGMAFLQTEQPASAFNVLCAAVNLKPDSGLTFMLLGCALMKIFDFENALKALRQAVDLSPQDPAILVNTALCLFYNQEYEECATFLSMFKDSLHLIIDSGNEMIQIAKQLDHMLSKTEIFDLIESRATEPIRQLSPDEV